MGVRLVRILLYLPIEWHPLSSYISWALDRLIKVRACVIFEKNWITYSSRLASIRLWLLMIVSNEVCQSVLRESLPLDVLTEIEAVHVSPSSAFAPN